MNSRWGKMCMGQNDIITLFYHFQRTLPQWESCSVVGGNVRMKKTCTRLVKSPGWLATSLHFFINFTSSDCIQAYAEMQAPSSPKSTSFVSLLSICLFFASVRSVPSLIGVHPLGTLLSLSPSVLNAPPGSDLKKLKHGISSPISPFLELIAPFGVYPCCELMLNSVNFRELKCVFDCRWEVLFLRGHKMQGWF